MELANCDFSFVCGRDWSGAEGKRWGRPWSEPPVEGESRSRVKPDFWTAQPLVCSPKSRPNN